MHHMVIPTILLISNPESLKPFLEGNLLTMSIKIIIQYNKQNLTMKDNNT